MGSEIKPTTEQQAVINYTGNNLVVIAFAGSGKTSTAVNYAIRNPDSRILYLAFNRAIRDEALRKFPPNVECKTSHQIAFAEFGRQYKDNLTTNLRLTDISRLLKLNDWPLAQDVFRHLQGYMQSSRVEMLNPSQSALRAQMRSKGSHEIEGANRNDVVAVLASVVWDTMIRVDHPFPITHDGYLKLYQISEPKLDQQYDTIIFDEAQDSNPVTSSIVTMQRCRKIFIGDPHQQIYRFRGANNAMRLLSGADVMYLTNSFRFGKNVAFIANQLLALKGETKPVVGLKTGDEIFTRPSSIRAGQCWIHRTVAGVIETSLLAMKQGLKTQWVGGMDSYQLNPIIDAYLLKIGRKEQITDKWIKGFETFAHYAAIAEATNDPEMSKTIRLIENFGNIAAVVGMLRQNETSDDNQPFIWVTTAHRSKGLEWDTVVLADDYPDIFDENLKESDRDDEINLLYVAATRAMKRIHINPTIETLLSRVAKIQHKKSP